MTGAATAAEHARAAEDLADAVDAIEAVDYNLILPTNLRTLLDARDEIEELCLRHRDHQHTAERRQDDR